MRILTFSSQLKNSAAKARTPVFDIASRNASAVHGVFQQAVRESVCFLLFSAATLRRSVLFAGLLLWPCAVAVAQTGGVAEAKSRGTGSWGLRGDRDKSGAEQEPATQEVARSGAGERIELDALPTLWVSASTGESEWYTRESPRVRPLVGGCREVTSTHTDASFTGGSFLVQAGFAEREIAAVSFELHPDDFPIQILSMECIFAQQNAEVTTSTEWAATVWEGTPTAGLIRMGRFSSLDGVLPTLVMNPGTAGTNIVVEIDPNDPEQVFVFNEGGSNRFTVGFTVEQHNNQSDDGCDEGELPPAQNAFPTTDVSGVASPSENYLNAINCGLLGCPSGWNPFSTLGLCRPSGDWVIRVTYCAQPRQLFGACCNPDASCDDGVESEVCQAIGSTFMGEGSLCDDLTCPVPTGACCLVGTCLSNLTPTECTNVNGTFIGSLTTCNNNPCDPWACCLPDGSCTHTIAVTCAQLGGTFQQFDTCDRIECPLPVGACCIGEVCINGQEQEACNAVGTWLGPATACGPTSCVQNPCPAATILDAVPPSDTVDARQPHPVNDNAPAARQGIGASGTPIILTLEAAGVPAECFTLCETAQDSLLGANDIDNVTDLGGGVYEIRLLHPITAGATTKIYYDSGESVTYISHPANANGDGAADTVDIIKLIDHLNGVELMPYGLYSVDMDHSNQAGATDIVRLIDLLNGAGTFSQAWNQTTKPTNGACP